MVRHRIVRARRRRADEVRMNKHRSLAREAISRLPVGYWVRPEDTMEDMGGLPMGMGMWECG